MTIQIDIRKEETNVRIAKANRDILLRCADALEDPSNIEDVIGVLRDEAKNFDEDASQAAARLRDLRQEARNFKDPSKCYCGIALTCPKHR